MQRFNIVPLLVFVSILLVSIPYSAKVEQYVTVTTVTWETKYYSEKGISALKEMTKNYADLKKHVDTMKDEYHDMRVYTTQLMQSGCIPGLH